MKQLFAAALLALVALPGCGSVPTAATLTTPIEAQGLVWFGQVEQDSDGIVTTQVIACSAANSQRPCVILHPQEAGR